MCAAGDSETRAKHDWLHVKPHVNHDPRDMSQRVDLDHMGFGPVIDADFNMGESSDSAEPRVHWKGAIYGLWGEDSIAKPHPANPPCAPLNIRLFA